MDVEGLMFESHAEARMKPAVNERGFDLATLHAVIARSPILVLQTGSRRRLAPCRHLPEGFDQTDIAVLDWIAEEVRRAGPSLRWI